MSLPVPFRALGRLCQQDGRILSSTRFRARHLVAGIVLLAGSPVCRAEISPTLDRIRKANTLTCGVDQAEAEFSTTNDHGARLAFDQDLCRAVAVAILGAAAQVSLKGYPDDHTAASALLSGEVDLIPTLTADFSHAAVTSLVLTRPVLYDGVGFLVPAKSGVSQAVKLTGHKICLLAETEVEVGVRTWFAAHHLVFLPFPFQEEGEMEAAFVTGNCSAIAGDLTRLAQTRTSLGADPADFLLLPEVISSDPLASVYRASDANLGAIVRWTLEALIEAERLGVTSENVAAQAKTGDPAVLRLLGVTHEIGAPLGLPNDWAAQVIHSVGNYGQIFDRDLGAASPMGLPRGQNGLSGQGGLLLALPFK